MRLGKEVIIILVVGIIVINILQVFFILSITGKSTGTVGVCFLGAPNMTQPADQTATESAAFSFQLNETSICGEPLNFTTHITPTLGSFAINSSTGLISFTPTTEESGTYEVQINLSREGFATDQKAFNLTINEAASTPTNFTCTRDTNGVDVVTTWNNLSTADNYTIFYSANISAIDILDVSSALPSDVTNITNLTCCGWNDTTANTSIKRYYTLSAWSSGAQARTTDISCGKFTYNYTVPESDSFGNLSTNRIIVYLNATYDAETFLQEIPAGFSPTISELEKNNASGEFLTVHVRGFAANNFTMDRGVAYQVSVTGEYNHTIVGPIFNDTYSHEYTVPASDSFGDLSTNWAGIYDANKTYFAEDFLQEIDGDLSPTISVLEKNNASGEFLTVHVRGFAANNFSLKPGIGYQISVTGEFNHTMCTNCLG